MGAPGQSGPSMLSSTRPYSHPGEEGAHHADGPSSFILTVWKTSTSTWAARGSGGPRLHVAEELPGNNSCGSTTAQQLRGCMTLVKSSASLNLGGEVGIMFHMPTGFTDSKVLYDDKPWPSLLLPLSFATLLPWPLTPQRAHQLPSGSRHVVGKCICCEGTYGSMPSHVFYL